MAKQFEESKAYLVGGNLLNRYEQAADLVLEDNPESTAPAPDPAPWQITVQNSTEDLLPAGAIVGRKSPFHTPADLTATVEDPRSWFYRQNNYEIEPYEPQKHGPDYMILLADLPAKMLGKAAIHGEAKVAIDITNVNHHYAQFPAGGDGLELESAASGPFRIIWKPTDATGAQLCAVQFPAPAAYSGYFAVVPWGADAVRVLDGSGENDDTAGPALINGESFTVAAETIEYSTSGTTYIWLQATSSGSTINAPTIESGSSLPAYETGKCKILLARIIAGRVVQEHTGPVQGIIWGDCGS